MRSRKEIIEVRPSDLPRRPGFSGPIFVMALFCIGRFDAFHL
jgi:hypothetical protein